MLSYQGQLLSELDNYTLVCSSQCDEVEHDQAARQDRQVVREPVLPDVTKNHQNTHREVVLSAGQQNPPQVCRLLKTTQHSSGSCDTWRPLKYKIH